MGPFAGENVAKQAGIIKLIEEPFDRRDIECVSVVAPQDLIPGGGRSVEQTLGSDDHPFTAIIQGNWCQQVFARRRVPEKSSAIIACRSKQSTIGAEVYRVDVRHMA